MSWVLTVKELKRMLEKYDDATVVMVSTSREGEAFEASPYPTYAYRSDDGEIVDDGDLENDDSFSKMERVLVIWGNDD